MRQLTSANRAIMVASAVYETSRAYEKVRETLHLTSRSAKEVIEMLALIDTYAEAVKEEMKVRSCI